MCENGKLFGSVKVNEIQSVYRMFNFVVLRMLVRVEI